MRIQKIEADREQFMSLLLLADEQEDMIRKYMNKGDMFVLYDKDQVCSVCIVVQKDGQTCELKNLATDKRYQRKGYGKQMVNYISEYYKQSYQYMIVGTGQSPLTLPFYQNCGFYISHRVKNFFIDNYDHPIFEAGKQLVDMIYLKKEL